MPFIPWYNKSLIPLIKCRSLPESYSPMCSVQSVWFLSLYSCYRVAANMEATEPSVPSGEIEVITWNVLRSRHDLVDRYGVSVVQMTTDMFHLSNSQSIPDDINSIIRNRKSKRVDNIITR
jgi:hypothetical protein